jgi:hypothetical protein
MEAKVMFERVQRIRVGRVDCHQDLLPRLDLAGVLFHRLPLPCAISIFVLPKSLPSSFFIQLQAKRASIPFSSSFILANLRWLNQIFQYRVGSAPLSMLLSLRRFANCCLRVAYSNLRSPLPFSPPLFLSSSRFWLLAPGSWCLPLLLASCSLLLATCDGRRSGAIISSCAEDCDARTRCGRWRI